MTNYERLLTGEVVVEGGKVLRMCVSCGKILNVAGWFKGLHLCSKKEDRQKIQEHLLERRVRIMERQ